MIIAYFPKPVSSIGVAAELKHAEETGKQRFLYHPKEDFSPFFTLPLKHFTSPTELVKFLKNSFGSKQEENKVKGSVDPQTK